MMNPFKVAMRTVRFIEKSFGHGAVNFPLTLEWRKDIMKKLGRIGAMAAPSILAIIVLATASYGDTTFVNVDLVPSGTLNGSAQAAGQVDHTGIFVYVGGTSIVGTTNAAGNYTIVGVPYGTYTLTFSRFGYSNATVSNVTVLSAGQVVSVPSAVLSPSPDQQANLFGQAMRLYSYDRNSDAITALRAAAAANPSGPYAAVSYYRVGLAFGQDNKYDSAITALSTVITNYPSDSIAADARYWRGAYKDAKLDFSGALTDFQYVVTNYPSYPTASRAQYRIGREQEALGNNPLAIAAYVAVETNYPTSPDVASAIYNAGWLYYSSDQYSSAIAEFDKLLTSHAGTAEAAKGAFYKGMAYYNQENFAQAITAFTTAISSYPQSDKVPTAWYYRANCKYQLESYTFVQAKADFQYIVDHFPNAQEIAHARYYLGSCEYDQGNGSAAISAYQAYLAAEPNNDWVPNARMKIANANYFLTLDYSAALSGFVTYYNTYPQGKDAGDAHYWAGRCYEKLNGSTNNVQAQNEYCTVMRLFPNCTKVTEATTRFATVGGTTCL